MTKNEKQIYKEIRSSQNEYLVDWIEKGICKNFVSEGYSITDFMEKRKMKYPAALLTMDWLIKEPERAKESLKRGLR